MGIFKPNIGKLKEKKHVKGLIKASKHKDSYVQREALEALGQMRDPRAVESITQALKDKDCFVRTTALSILERKADARAVEPLIQALKDRSLYIEKIVRALGNTADARAVEPLIQVLKHKHKDVREKATEALGKIKDVRAVEPLVLILMKDKDKDVRGKSAEALGKTGNARAVEPLVRALEDDSSLVRSEAAEALEKIGWTPRNDAENAYYLAAMGKWDELRKLGKPAVELLIRTLKYKDGYVRMKAATALGEIGNERAVEALIQALRDARTVRKKAAEALEKIGWKPGDDVAKVHYLFAKEKWDELVKLGEPVVEILIGALKDTNVRREAARALGEIGDTRAVEPLIQALRDEYWHHAGHVVEASRALGKIGKLAVEPLIQVLLQDDRWPVRKVATRALGDIGDARAVEPLVRVLKQKKRVTAAGHEEIYLHEVRRGAARALGEIGDARAVDPLIRALEDEDSILRSNAKEALEKIKTKKS